MEILSPVEKLINYRKMYKISQQELVKDKIARSYLAMIESRRKKLNKKIASVLVDNFNSIVKEKGVNYILTIEHLLEDKEIQITRLTSDLLNDISIENIEEISLKIEKLFLKETSYTNKKKLYIKIGELYFLNKEYEKANKYFFNITKDLIQNADMAAFESIAMKIFSGSMALEKYEDNIRFYNYINIYFDNFSTENKKKILFLIGLSYLNLELYNDALEYFSDIEKKSTDDEESFELKMLQGRCQEGKACFDVAFSIYRGALLKYKEEDKKLIINYELLKLSKKIEDENKIRLYLKKVIMFLDSVENMENKELIIYEVAKISKYLGKRKQSINYYLELIKKTDSITLKFDCIKEVLPLFIKSELKEVRELEQIYLKHLNENRVFDIGYQFLNFYTINKFERNKDNFTKLILKFI